MCPTSAMQLKMSVYVDAGMIAEVSPMISFYPWKKLPPAQPFVEGVTAMSDNSIYKMYGSLRSSCIRAHSTRKAGAVNPGSYNQAQVVMPGKQSMHLSTC